MRRNVILALLLIATVLGNVLSARTDDGLAYTNDCDGWSRELGIYKRVKNSPTMHQMGCTDKPNVNARYNAAKGYCPYKARYLARHGYRGTTLVSIMRNKFYCFRNSNGTYTQAYHS